MRWRMVGSSNYAQGGVVFGHNQPPSRIVDPSAGTARAPVGADRLNMSRAVMVRPSARLGCKDLVCGRSPCIRSRSGSGAERSDQSDVEARAQAPCGPHKPCTLQLRATQFTGFDEHADHACHVATVRRISEVFSAKVIVARRAKGDCG